MELEYWKQIIMDKKHCSGCRNNFYNGNNNLGIAKCWGLKDAKLVTRISIGHWENPPYLNKKKIRVPNCWHGEDSNHIHYVDPKKDLDSRGYWK